MNSQLVSLHKRSISEKIPVPPRKPLQLEDVPMWTKLPYDTKYPLPKCREKDITLSREELGKSLYPTFPSKEFDLTISSTPNLGPSGYSSLHDPHLRHYFKSANRYKNLVKKGFITEDGRVKTCLREYNQYRMYLYHLWAMQVNQLRKFQASEERKLLESLVEARDSGDSLYNNVVKKYKNIKVEDILDEVLPSVFEEKASVNSGSSPFVRSLIHWKAYQEQLERHFRNSYPAVKKWLSEQTRHYKQYMEKKLNTRRNRDNKGTVSPQFRNRWERICESSRHRFSKELRLHESEKQSKLSLSEQRYSRIRNRWDKEKREIQLKRKRERSKSLTKQTFSTEDLNLKNNLSRFTAKRQFPADQLESHICISTEEFKYDEEYGAKRKQQKVSEMNGETDTCSEIIDPYYIMENLEPHASLRSSNEKYKNVAILPKFEKTISEVDIKMNRKLAREHPRRSIIRYDSEYPSILTSKVKTVSEIKPIKSPKDMEIENRGCGTIKWRNKRKTTIFHPLTDTVTNCLDDGTVVQTSQHSKKIGYCIPLNQMKVQGGNERKLSPSSASLYSDSREKITEDIDSLNDSEFTANEKLEVTAMLVKEAYKRDNTLDLNALQLSGNKLEVLDNVCNEGDERSEILDGGKNSENENIRFSTVKIDRGASFHPVEEYKLLKYLYGLPELSKVNVKTTDKRELCRKVKPMESGISKNNLNVERTDRTENEFGPKCEATKSPVSKDAVKSFNKNREPEDTWKMLEISINYKIKEYQNMLGLEKSKLLSRRNEKIQNEIASLISGKRKVDTCGNKKGYFAEELKNIVTGEYLESVINKTEVNSSDTEKFKKKIRPKIIQNDLFNIEHTCQILSLKQLKAKIHSQDNLITNFKQKSPLDVAPKKRVLNEMLPEVSAEKCNDIKSYIRDSDNDSLENNNIDCLVSRARSDTYPVSTSAFDASTGEEKMLETPDKTEQKCLSKGNALKQRFTSLNSKSHLDENKTSDEKLSSFLTKKYPVVIKRGYIQSPTNYRSFQPVRGEETYTSTVMTEELKYSNECLNHSESHLEAPKKSKVTGKNIFSTPLFPSALLKEIKKSRELMFSLPILTEDGTLQKKDNDMTKLSEYRQKDKKFQTNIELYESDKHLKKTKIRTKMENTGTVNESHNISPLKLLAKDRCIKNKILRMETNYLKNLLDDVIIEAEAFKIKSTMQQNSTHGATVEQENSNRGATINTEKYYDSPEDTSNDRKKNKAHEDENDILQSNLSNRSEERNSLEIRHSSKFDIKIKIEPDFFEKDIGNRCNKDNIHEKNNTDINEFRRDDNVQVAETHLKNIDSKKLSKSTEFKDLDEKTSVVDVNDITKEEVNEFEFKNIGVEKIMGAEVGTSDNSENQNDTTALIEKNIFIEKCILNRSAASTPIKLSTRDELKNTNDKRTIYENIKTKSKCDPKTCVKLVLNTSAKDAIGISKFRYDFEKSEITGRHKNFNYTFVVTDNKDGLTNLEAVAKEIELSSIKMLHVPKPVDFIFDKPNNLVEEKKKRISECKLNGIDETYSETEYKEKKQNTINLNYTQNILELDLDIVSSTKKGKNISQEAFQNYSNVPANAKSRKEIQNPLTTSRLKNLIHTSDGQTLDALDNTEIVGTFQQTKFTSSFKRNSSRNLSFRDTFLNSTSSLRNNKLSLAVTLNEVNRKHQSAIHSKNIINDTKMNRSCDTRDLTNMQLISMNSTDDTTRKSYLLYDKIEEKAVKANKDHSDSKYEIKIPLFYFSLAQSNPAINFIAEFIFSENLPCSTCLKQDNISLQSIKSLLTLFDRKIISRSPKTILGSDREGKGALNQLDGIFKSQNQIDKNYFNILAYQDKTVSNFDQPTLLDLSLIHPEEVDKIVSEMLKKNSRNHFQLCISKLSDSILPQMHRSLTSISLSSFSKFGKVINKEKLPAPKCLIEVSNTDTFKVNPYLLPPCRKCQYVKKDKTTFYNSNINFHESPEVEKGYYVAEFKPKASFFVAVDGKHLNNAREQTLNMTNDQNEYHVANSLDKNSSVCEASSDKISEYILLPKITQKENIQSDEENYVGFKGLKFIQECVNKDINAISKKGNDRNITHKCYVSNDKYEIKWGGVMKQDQNEINLEKSLIFQNLNIYQDLQIQPASNCSIDNYPALKHRTDISVKNDRNVTAILGIHTSTVLPLLEFSAERVQTIMMNPFSNQISHTKPFLRKTETIEVPGSVATSLLKYNKNGRYLIKNTDLFITKDREILSKFPAICENCELDRNFPTTEIENSPGDSSKEDSKHVQLETNFNKETDSKDISSKALTEIALTSSIYPMEMEESLLPNIHQARINNALICDIVNERLQHLATHFRNLNNADGSFSSI